ncbi:MAG TPA: TetR/AcrR family transcriptional regulator [Candidimonas sp.]|nr:TetR/AcrR family transcriptional regulator [Candidimonas sp.]
MQTRTRNLPADERRTVTVQAVIELAGEQNPGDITTAAIAARMGLTQGALFRHFANKDAVWHAVMEWVGQRLLERLDHAMQEAPSPLDAMQAMFLTHIDFVAQHPGVPCILFAELQRPDETPAKRAVQDLIRQYGERLHRVIEEGKAQGQLWPQLDTRAGAILFIGSIQGLVMQSLLAGDVQRLRQDAGPAFEIYRRGIRSAS